MFRSRLISLTVLCSLFSRVSDDRSIWGQEPVLLATDPTRDSDDEQAINLDPSIEQEEVVSLLSKAPLPMDQGDPVSLIKAVNRLFALGKSDAIVSIREFVNANPSPVAQQRLCLIIPLLFAPVDRELPPEPWFDRKREVWSGAGGRLEVAVHGGIPFDISGEYTIDGYVAPIGPLVDWAARYGDFRSSPLVPTNDPISAADALHCEMVTSLNDLVQYRVGFESHELDVWLKQHLRRQAMLVAAWQNEGNSN